MKIVLLILLLFCTTIGVAQERKVTGRVTDARGTAIGGVKVKSPDAVNRGVNADSTGYFEIVFEDVTKNQVELTIVPPPTVAEDTILTIRFNGRDSIALGNIRYPFLQQTEIIVTQVVDNPFEIDYLEIPDLAQVPGGTVEKFIALTTAAVSNNELTSNYNVRGGSFDENLVYVNGFKVYRPFLTRAGQQEGMPFIHTALVEDIKFSAGGFASNYGDKLSSVLDITYKEPDSLHASFNLSFLGLEGHVESQINSRTNFIAGARYRSNGYFLNSLPTKGAYNPVFWDGQFMINHKISEKLTWSTLGHFSSNNFQFAPQTQETDFGTANEAYSLVIYFQGQEQTRFQTMMGGTALKWEPKEGTNLDFYATVFNTDEREYFDIEGQYFINELETDASSEDFGDSIAVLGVGSFLNHARNRLNATIINVYHDGSQLLKQKSDVEALKAQKHELKWGVNFQMDQFADRLSEWRLVDSAGYSLPQTNDSEVEVFEVIKGELSLTSQRYTSYVQLNSTWSNFKRRIPVEITKSYRDSNDVKAFRTYYDTVSQSSSRWALSVGSRGGYTSANGEFYITPRATIKFLPRAYMLQDDQIIRRRVEHKFSAGLYYQPPFYREFRTFAGDLNLNVLAQKSLHLVGGSSFEFNMWEREVPFKFSIEGYYKYLWDINTFEIENVRMRYYANNEAVGYAYGLDMNIHGEFIKGLQSFFKVGLLRTREDVIGDQYTEYYNAAGERIVFGISNDQEIVDSAVISPGFIPRPTDQLLNFGALIQDRMPKYESFTVQLGLQFATPLPYGPPDFNRYKDTLRLRSYFRVDLGMSYDFLYKHQKALAEGKTNLKSNFWTRNFEDAIISFEVFNLLGVNNVLSKQWVQDVNGRFYSVPNFLTQRRFNLKLILRI
ncbi:MAG: carboxypeptidase-like regulatory domain-containing protein [Crocinitomicaceae bacterium]